MSNLILQLPSGESVSIDKARLQEIFPNSTLSQALQSDPELDQVNLDLNILPSTLNLIPSALNDTVPPESIYDQASADQLATTTGIPYLSLMVDPQYPTFLEVFQDQYPGKSPTDVSMVNDAKFYDQIVAYAILSNWPRLLQYFFSITTLWAYTQDQEYLKEAIENNTIDIIPILEQRIQSYDDRWNEFLTAIDADDVKTVSRDIETGMIDPSWNQNEALYRAITNQQLDIIIALISSGKVNAKAEFVDSNTPLQLAIQTSNPLIVETFLQYVEPTQDDLILAIEYHYYQSVRALLDSGYINLEDNYRDVLLSAIESGNLDILGLIVFSNGVDVNIPDEEIRRALALNPDVVDYLYGNNLLDDETLNDVSTEIM